MSQSAVTLGAVTKDVWDSNRLYEQFDRQNRMLARLERVEGRQIGNQLQIAIRAGRAGSFTSVGPAGGQLNPATAQPVNQAIFTVPYNWFQIELETSAIAQTGSAAVSAISAKDLEIEGAVENTRHQIQRMVATNGDGIVAACATTASSTTIGLTAAANEGTTY